MPRVTDTEREGKSSAGPDACVRDPRKFVAPAMIDRLVNPAEVIALKGDSYRIEDRDLGRVPGSSTEE